MDRGQRSWGTSLLRMKVRKPGLMHLNNLPGGGEFNEIIMACEVLIIVTIVDYCNSIVAGMGCIHIPHMYRHTG